VKQEAEHEASLSTLMLRQFYISYTFLVLFDLMISDKYSLSAVRHLDGKSQFLNTGLELGIFKYIYV
jgi:hypothetical protein